MMKIAQTIESLRQQLAECQATNLQMRGLVDQFLVENDTTEFGCACHPGEGYTCGTCRTFDRQLPLRQAIALPNDATALNELIAERTKELTAEVERLKSEVVCGDCDGSGWLENRVEGRYPCTCMTEAEPYQLLEHQNAELTAQRDAAMNKLSTLKAIFIKNMLRFMTNKTKHEIADEIDAAIINHKERDENRSE